MLADRHGLFDADRGGHVPSDLVFQGNRGDTHMINTNTKYSVTQVKPATSC